MEMTRFYRLLIQHRWLVLILALLLAGLVSAGAGKLYFRGDYRTFFKPDNPQLLTYEAMQKQFNKSDNLLVGIAPRDGQVFTADTLALVQQMTGELWQTPYSLRIDSLTNFQHSAGQQDDLVVGPLLESGQQLTPAVINNIRQISLQEPLLLQRLISKDGTVTAINISLKFPDTISDADIRQSYQHVSALIDKYQQKHPQVDFYLTGVVALNYSFSMEAEQDSIRLIPLMFIALVLMLLWLLNSVYATLATLVVILSSITMTLGVAGWTGYFISVTTVNVPIFIMTLAVADSVHLVLSMQRAQRQGMAKEQAVQYAVSHNFVPVILTSVTTAIGFLTFNFSEVPILRDLGNLTAFGVILVCALSLTLLPSLLAILPAPVQPARSDRKAMNLLGTFLLKWHKPVFAAGFIVTVMSGFSLSLNVVNDEPLKYFSPETTFRQANDFMEQRLSPGMTIDIMLESGEPGGINTPEFLQRVQELKEWLSLQPEIVHVVSVTDIYKRLNKNMNGDQAGYDQLPQQRELAAQYLLLYEMSLPKGLDMGNLVDIDKSAVKSSATIRNLGSKELIELEKRIQNYLETRTDYNYSLSGAALMFAHISENNMNSMLLSLPLAIALISLLLAIVFRSWQIGCLSLLANLIPGIIGFGIWGIYRGEINLGLSVVASMALGLIVDDTIHFICNYRRARSQGHNTSEAVQLTLTNIGFAIWTTSVVLIIGFGILLFSSFRLNADMGMLTALIILVALFTCMILFPAFLLSFDRRTAQQRSLTPSLQSPVISSADLRQEP